MHWNLKPLGVNTACSTGRTFELKPSASQRGVIHTTIHVRAYAEALCASVNHVPTGGLVDLLRLLSLRGQDLGLLAALGHVDGCLPLALRLQHRGPLPALRLHLHPADHTEQPSKVTRSVLRTSSPSEEGVPLLAPVNEPVDTWDQTCVWMTLPMPKLMFFHSSASQSVRYRGTAGEEAAQVDGMEEILNY